MKTAKKISALLLVAAMLLASAVSGFAEDQEASSPDHVAQLLSSLQIVDDSFDSDINVPITRAEFAVLTCRLAGMFSPIAGSDTNFKDVIPNSFEEPYIYTAVKAGYMAPVKNEYFYPAWAVTAEDASRAMVMTLGYGDPKKQNNRFTDYALSIGLFSGVDAAGAFTRGKAHRMIYNALHSKVLEQVSFGSVSKYEQVKGMDALYKFHRVVRTRGFVNGAGGVIIGDSAAKLPEGYIELNGTRFYMAEYEMHELLGRNVWLYWRDDEDKDIKDVVSINKITDDEITINAKDIETFSEMTYKYTDEGRSRNIKLVEPYVIYNGEMYTGAYTEKIMHPESGDVTVIANASGSGYDVVIIRSFVDCLVKAVITADNVLVGYSGERYVFDSQEGIRYFNANGSAATFGNITPDVVVTIAQSISENKAEVYISKETLRGGITQIDSENEYWTINDVEYKVTKHLEELIDSGEVKKPDLNSEYTFYLNCFGDIVYYDEIKAGSASSRFYGIITRANFEGGLRKNLQVKLYAKKLGGFGVFECTERVLLNGESEKQQKVYDALLRDGRHGEKKDKPVAQVVKVGLNADNKINYIYQAGSETDGDGFFMYCGSITEKGNYYPYRNVLSIKAPDGMDFDSSATRKHIGFNPNTEFIQAPYFSDGRLDADNEKSYIGVRAPSSGATRFLAYKENADDLTASLVIMVTDSGEKLHTENTFNVQMLVSIKQAVVNEETVTVLKTNKYSYYINNSNIDCSNLKIFNSLGEYTQETHSLRPGDLVNIVADSQNYIQAIEVVYDSKNRVMMGRGGKNTDYEWYTRDGVYNLVFINLMEYDGLYIMGTQAPPEDYNPLIHKRYLGRVPTMGYLDEKRDVYEFKSAVAADLIGYRDSQSDWVSLIISHRYNAQSGMSFLHKR